MSPPPPNGDGDWAGGPTPPRPAGGSPAPPPPPPPELHPARQQRGRWLKIAAFAVLGLIVFIAGCSVLVWRFVSGPIDAANEFLADVSAGDFAAAVEHIDPGCFEPGDTTPDRLAEVFGQVETYDLTSVSADSTNGVSTGQASGTISRPGHGEQDIAFNMSKPDDDWLVCGYRLDG